jgi:ribonuclease-3
MSLSLLKSLIPNSRRASPPGEPIEKIRLAELKVLARRLGIPLGNPSLLNEALTHKSYTYERKLNSEQNNEKLEFLGDSVLGLIVSQYVFETYPEVTEGGLSKVKSVVVSAQVLGEKAQGLDLGRYLRLGKGEEKTGGKNRPSLLADALEAVIGAVYLTHGLAMAEKLVLGLLKEDIGGVFTGRLEKDHKTLLQEYFQKTRKLAPHYDVVKEWGPDHNRNFEAACKVDGEVISKGVGKSKKEAEQVAAQEAIRALKVVVTTPQDHRIHR